MPMAVAFCLTVLCAVIIYSDLRYMRIPDWVTVAALLLFFGLLLQLQEASTNLSTRRGNPRVRFVVAFPKLATDVLAATHLGGMSE